LNALTDGIESPELAIESGDSDITSPFCSEVQPSPLEKWSPSAWKQQSGVCQFNTDWNLDGSFCFPVFAAITLLGPWIASVSKRMHRDEKQFNSLERR
jgi:hypothetical protein